LGGDEEGGIDEGSGPAGESGIRALAGWEGVVWRGSYSEMGSRIVKTMWGMGGRVDAMVLRAYSPHHFTNLLSSVATGMYKSYPELSILEPPGLCSPQPERKRRLSDKIRASELEKLFTGRCQDPRSQSRP